MTKNSIIVKVVVFMQLLLALLIACACVGGVLFPFMGVVGTNEVTYDVTEEQEDWYEDKFLKVVKVYYPDYNKPKNFWNIFADYEIYDLFVQSSGNISFCIDKTYTFWGINFGDLTSEKPYRYSIDIDNNIDRTQTDINLGIVCTRDRSESTSTTPLVD